MRWLKFLAVRSKNAVHTISVSKYCEKLHKFMVKGANNVSQTLRNNTKIKLENSQRLQQTEHYDWVKVGF